MSDRYNIEIELKAKLQEAYKTIETLNEIAKGADVLTERVSETNTVLSGAYMELGAKITDLSLKVPTIITASIKAFGEEELAVQKLSAAIRHNGGMVSEADI